METQKGKASYCCKTKITLYKTRTRTGHNHRNQRKGKLKKKQKKLALLRQIFKMVGKLQLDPRIRNLITRNMRKSNQHKM